MSDIEVAIDKFLALRKKHRAARAAEENAYYTATAAKEQVVRSMGLDPYKLEDMAAVGKAIRERETKLERAGDDDD